MTSMPPLLIPDWDSPEWKKYSSLKTLDISTSVKKYLDDDYVANITNMWLKFGDGKRNSLPKTMDVPQVKQTEISSEAGGNYMAVAAQLKQSYETLLSTLNAVAKDVGDAADKLQKYQDAIGTDITKLSDLAATPPGDGQDENTHILTFTSSGLKQMETDINKATDAMNGKGSDVNDQTKKLQDLTDKYNTLDGKYQDLLDKYNALLKGGASGSSGASGSYDPGALGNNTGASGASGSSDISWNPPDLSGASGSSDASGVTGSSDPSNVSGSTGSTDPGSSSSTDPGSVGSSDTGSSGLSDISSMLGPMMEMMQMQSMMRNQSDQNPNNQLQQPYPPGYQQGAPAQAAPAQAAPAAPAQAPAQTAPNGPGTTAPPAGPPARIPGADGLVDYTFPDGRVQKVSPVVANALDAAFANQAGTDAQAAYAQGANTPAKWSDPKQIGDRVDPSQLMTGDVATWDSNHTAIVIVWGSAQGGGSGSSDGSGQDGSLQVIVDGQQKDFTPQISGKAGDFGNFSGFAHPHGIEASASNDGSGAHALPATGDPTGGQTPQPAAAAPGS
ncbi:hypothetical protein [Nocardia miyunensis]|uniref:hypothetical protein n=1 Tax=Nocardia miyunensis TaxID=282684 RepID=UPI00083583DE|nr:hypothetical protein [Nocardia miyunensis]